MKRFLLVFLVLLFGCFCLSAETIKGKYYEDGVKYIYSLSHYPIEDESGVFSLSEAQELLESLGWDDYDVLKNNATYFSDLKNEIFETLSDDVEYSEDINLIEIKIKQDDKVLQAYIFVIDWIHSTFNCNCGYYLDTLLFVRELK